MTAAEEPLSLTATCVADVLGVLGALFRYHPEESLIVLAIHGPDQQFGFRARLDLPEPKHAETAAAVLAGHLVTNDAMACVALAISSDARASETALRALSRELPRREIAIAAIARADGTRYWEYNAEVSNTPEPRHYDAHAHPLLVKAVVAGSTVHRNREAMAQQFDPVAGDLKDEMDYFTCQASTLVNQLVSEDGATDLAAAGVAIISEIRERRAPQSHEYAMVNVLAAQPRIRDHLWKRITQENAPGELRFWTRAAQLVVAPYEANVLCLAGFAAWASGDGSMARVAYERALSVEPEHRWANALQDLLDTGSPPSTWFAVIAAQ